MDYDDQHYSEVNPDTLDLQDPAEVMLTVWAALRPCREITSQGRNRESNFWIKWAEPKRWNPDCGFEVFTPGKHFGKTKFATVAFNIVGNDYEIHVQRRFHDVVPVFSTRDDGPVLSPKARLKAAVSKMLELTSLFDQWSRNQELEQHFRPDWLGTSASTLFKALVANWLLEKEWTSGSWRRLAREIARETFVRPQDDIELRTDSLMRRKALRRPVAASMITLKTLIFLSLAISLSLALLYFVSFWLSSNSYLDRLYLHWVTTWRAVEGIFNPSQFENVRSWFDSFIDFPLFVGVSVFIIGITLVSIAASVRYATAIIKFLANRSAGLQAKSVVMIVVVLITVLALGFFSRSMLEPALEWAATTSPAEEQRSNVEPDPATPDAELRQILRVAADPGISFSDRFEAEVWLTDMSRRLTRQVPDPVERIELLKLIHMEASRVELPPELILAVIEVESNFDRYAVSVDGALGLMQIMPYWLNEIGRPNDNLLHTETNLRYGCTILRFYLDKENGDLRRALGRYDGSLGKRKYPNKVIDKLSKKWFQA